MDVFEWKKAQVINTIVSLPVFRQSELTLFSGIPLRDLEYKGKPYAENPHLNENRKQSVENWEVIDILICKGKQVLLAIMLEGLIANEDECFWAGPVSDEVDNEFYGISTLRLDAEQIDRGIDDILGNWISGKLESESIQPCSVSMNYIPPGLLKKLAKKNLLKEKYRFEKRGENLSEKVGFEATRYGTAIGIVNGWAGRKDNRVLTGLFCAARGNQMINEELEWEKDSQLKTRYEKLSFDERLRKLNSNRPSNDRYSVALIRKFANATIDLYLQNFPDDLEDLKIGLFEKSGLTGNITFQQAASAIYQLMQSEENRTSGKEMMRILALPQIKAFERRIKQNGK